MILALINRLSDWNPQLFRELKGRLKPRTLAITIASSLVFQGILVLFFYILLPGEKDQYSSYQICPPVMAGTTATNCMIDWQEWWLDIFKVESRILPLILLIGGVGMIMADMAEEERRGTLNFIRLSPQSSQSILVGKLLGVPALIYLAVALAIPLHLVSAIGADVPFSFLFSFYLLIGVACCFFYSLGLFSIFATEAQARNEMQAGFGCILAGLCSIIALSIMFSLLDWSRFSYDPLISELRWFHLPIGSSVATIHGFIILTLCGCTYGIWKALNRRFRNSNSTIISKHQSYWSSACFNIWLVGFLVVYGYNSGNVNDFKEDLEVILFGLIVLNLVWFLFLIGALSPHRQALLDWSCYRHKQNADVRTQSPEEILNAGLKLQIPSVWQDLIWGEKSPAVVAIAINLALTAVIYFSWILTWPAHIGKFQAMASFMLSISLILIYSLIAQMMLLLKTKKRATLALNAVMVAILAPPTLLTLLSIDPKVHSIVWLLSIGAWPAVHYASAMSVFLALLGQWGIISLLSLQLTRHLRKAGESLSKPLLTSSAP